jgi:chaperonin GroES
MKKSKKMNKKSPKKASQAAKPVNTMGIMPLGDGVLIKPEAAEKTTPSGIIIPDTAKEEKATVGRVVAVGPGKVGDDNVRIPMQVKVGQKVYFNQGWESEMEWQGEKYYLVHESDVRAILD